MARGGATRFQPGQSGNPGGRPKARRPHVSAFDIVLDQSLKVTQGGEERALSIDEALELQTYQAALGGSRMAIRKVLKMIEKREVALARLAKPRQPPIKIEMQHTAYNMLPAMVLLGIADPDPGFGGKRHKLQTWATQAALSRPGRRVLEEKDIRNVRQFTWEPDKLRWPKGLRE